MNETLRSFVDQALKLSEADRFELAHLLLDTLAEEDTDQSIEDPEFIAELDRRFNDKSKLISLEEIHAMRNSK